MGKATGSHLGLFGVAMLLCATTTNAQELPKGWKTVVGHEVPFGVAMYSLFVHVTSIDEERPGYGARLVLHTIGIEDEAKAAALSDYMVTAFYAGRGSSAQREREFCALDITTREDLIRGLQDRERAHNAELDRLAAGAAKVVDSGDYAKLVEYAVARQSRGGLLTFDPEAAYGTGSVDVSAEIARRCADLH